MISKKLTLEQFVKRYSQANQSPYDVLKAAANKLDPQSSAQQVAKQCLEKWDEFEEYLVAAGFEF